MAQLSGDVMPVYIDTLVGSVKSKQWPFVKCCHMFADTDDELHAMARRLGMRKSWFQKSRRLPHYDLTANKRRNAISLGAESVDWDFTAKFMRRRKSGFIIKKRG